MSYTVKIVAPFPCKIIPNFLSLRSFHLFKRTVPVLGLCISLAPFHERIQEDTLSPYIPHSMRIASPPKSNHSFYAKSVFPGNVNTATAIVLAARIISWSRCGAYLVPRQRAEYRNSWDAKQAGRGEIREQGVGGGWGGTGTDGWEECIYMYLWIYIYVCFSGWSGGVHFYTY